MCGIFGMVHGLGGPPSITLLERMGRVIQHRGPDDAGYFISGRVGLGMRRLSIIDLAGGSQPIFNEDRSKVIVFNGEIYNFSGLRDNLVKEGHVFSTRTDTEVILHLYEEKGEGCVNDLVGMFAFAVWDIKKERLFLARDRFGEKPLYYYWDGKQLIFASEIKSILCNEGIDRSLDWKAVGDYFTFMNTLAPATVFGNIRKLMPAHFLVFEGGRIRQERYWSYRLDAGHDEGEVYYRETLLARLKDSIAGQLVSDVPLGAFLSGGIDSSTVVALMSELSGKVKTFSIGFEETDFNELNYARKAAAAFGTDHHEFVLKPDAVDVLDDIVWHLDEPFADPSAIPTYFVSKIARQEVKVALSGDGGDELLAGYPSYRAEYLLNKARAVPKFARDAVSHGLKVMPATPWAGLNYQARRFGKMLDRVDMSPVERFLSRHRLFGLAEMKKLFMPEIMEQGIAAGDGLYLNGLLPQAGYEPVNQMLHLDAHVYLPNDMLVKVDRMSMAHSLEVREPFLDHRLAEFAGSVPLKYKLRGMTTKYVLREAMKDKLPADIIKRRKMGFSIPLNVWFRNNLDGYAREVLLDDTTQRRGIFNRAYVEDALDTHLSKQEDKSGQIWAMIMFEKWCRIFLDGGRAC